MNKLSSQLEQFRIVPVVAIDSSDRAKPLANALEAGGLPCAEITLRTDSAFDAIRQLTGRADFVVGAGTVHSVDQAKAVADAGAAFVVTPGFNPNTVAWCIKNDLPVVPGISCPTDLEMALEFGLQVVKFFPAEAIGGIKMLKALSGPYGGIRFVPTGGISPANLANYLSLPQVLACGGSWMVKSDLISEGRFDEITQLTAQAMSLANKRSNPA